jgi:hypothetical protein
VIFDKSGDLIMLYSNPKYDKSDDILAAMGYKSGTKSGGDSKGSGPSKSSSGEAPPAEQKK